MKLSGAADAFVPRRKLDGYLLSSTHSDGRHKERFFGAVGFERADALETALLKIAREGVVIAEVTTGFGRKYLVDGHLNTARGIRVPLRTAWMVERETEAPRFVTAYPR